MFFSLVQIYLKDPIDGMVRAVKQIYWIVVWSCSQLLFTDDRALVADLEKVHMLSGGRVW
jgi:hypothetical protein